MASKNIIDMARDYVLQHFSSNIPRDICFHNITHTKEVVKAAIEIANEFHFSQKQIEVVALAAWFHDFGYITTFINHEEYSKTVAADFLNRYDYPKQDIEQVVACIEATRFPQNATSPAEEVLADADLYHFTKPNYQKYEQQLRKEFNAYLGKIFTDAEWNETNYTLLKNHSYYTEYGKNVLQKFKEVNIKRLKTMLIK